MAINRNTFLTTQVRTANVRDKKKNLIDALPQIAHNRNLFSQVRGNNIPDTVKNAVLDLVQSEGNTTPKNSDLKNKLIDLCNASLQQTSNNADVINLRRLAQANDTNMLSETGLFTGKAYENINYLRKAENNPTSMYHAIKHKQRVIIKYEIFLKDLQSKGIKIPERAFDALKEARNSLALPDPELHYAKAKKQDWQVQISPEGRAPIKIEKYMQTIIEDLKLQKPHNQNLNKAIINKALKLAYIKSQGQDLNTNLYTHHSVNLSDSRQFISSIEKVIDYTNPPHIRGAIYNDLPQETKDAPILLYKHTMSVDQNNKLSIIRCGHIHGAPLGAANIEDATYVPPAAMKYVEQMAELGKFTNSAGEKVLVDNRLMYDHGMSRFGGERKLINYHQKAINLAISKYNSEVDELTRGGPRLKIHFLNFPPKDYQNKTKNMQSIRDFIIEISSTQKHNELYINNKKYKAFYNMLMDKSSDPNYFSGKNGYDYAFVTQFVCTHLGIAFSEGCKSNKDRGSMKKMHDEIYYVKAQEMQDNEITSNINDFFSIRYKDKSASREIVLNNSSAHITGLGASFAGNKNTAGVNKLISDLGFPNYRQTGWVKKKLGIVNPNFFTGMSHKAKG